MPATRRFAPPSRTMKEASVSSAVQGGELADLSAIPGGRRGWERDPDRALSKLAQSGQ